MKIIIDTHIFLWALAEPEKLSVMHRKELQGLYNQIYVSAITVAELMIKSSIGKLQVDFNPLELVQQIGFELLDFSGKDALMLKELPFHHKDPFDRMLIAQSLANDFYLMTEDKQFQRYGCKLV